MPLPIHGVDGYWKLEYDQILLSAFCIIAAVAKMQNQQYENWQFS